MKQLFNCMVLRWKAFYTPQLINLSEKTQYVTLHRAYITGALVAVYHEVHTDSSEAPYLNTGGKILILLWSREMNEILKNTHVFVDVLCMSRCDAVRQWDEGAFQKAYKWANYFEEVTSWDQVFQGLSLDLLKSSFYWGSYIFYRT